MWELNGIVGRGNTPPHIAGSESGTAVVMGSGRCIWDDINKIGSRIEKMGVICINDMILHWRKRVHHGVSLHPEEPPLWRSLRKTNRCDANHVTTHSHRIPKGPDHLPISNHGLDCVWDIERSGAGSSGLLACMIGLALGYERIILAGVPLDDSGHFFDIPDVRTSFNALNIQLEWKDADQKYLKGRVKSLSGYSAKWLGEVPQEWLND